MIAWLNRLLARYGLKIVRTAKVPSQIVLGVIKIKE